MPSCSSHAGIRVPILLNVPDVSNRDSSNTASGIMRDMADLLDDAELCVYMDGKPVISKSKDEDKKIESENKEKQRKTQKPPFKFHMIGLNIGDTIVFDALNLSVKIASDDKIEYAGRLYSYQHLPQTFCLKISKTLRELIKGLSISAITEKT